MVGQALRGKLRQTGGGVSNNVNLVMKWRSTRSESDSLCRLAFQLWT